MLFLRFLSGSKQAKALLKLVKAGQSWLKSDKVGQSHVHSEKSYFWSFLRRGVLEQGVPWAWQQRRRRKRIVWREFNWGQGQILEKIKSIQILTGFTFGSFKSIASVHPPPAQTLGYGRSKSSFTGNSTTVMVPIKSAGDFCGSRVCLQYITLLPAP